MARRKKKFNLPTQYIKIAIIVLLGVGVLVGLCWGVSYIFSHSKMFVVKSVSVDPSISFIHRRDYNKFIGKNIFQIDIKKDYRRLSYKYPQIDGLKIVRQFPDQILLVAKQRVPFAQISTKDKVLTIDDRGMLLSTTSKLNNKLPHIEGVSLSGTDMILGKNILSRSVKVALLIVNKFREAKTLSSYQILKLDMVALSKIQLTLSNDLVIIMGAEDIGYKISVLNLLISQHRFSSKDTKYIDLRFKEPVIGKK